MTHKDIALLSRHPLLVLCFLWDTERYHAAHYICHVQQQRQAELGRQELLALIDHYMRMSASDMVEEMKLVQPCNFCDLDKLFGQRDRRAYEREAA